MTRLVKLDWDEVEREYVYDGSSNPVSYTQLAVRHNTARSAVAEHGTSGRWPEKRKAFREALGIKAIEAVSAEWVGFETAVRAKTTAVGLKYLDQFEKALDAGEIQVNTKDAISVIAMLREFAKEAAAAAVTNEAGEVKVIDPDSHQLDPDTARRALAALDAIDGSPEGTSEERAS